MSGENSGGIFLSHYYFETVYRPTPISNPEMFPVYQTAELCLSTRITMVVKLFKLIQKIKTSLTKTAFIDRKKRWESLSQPKCGRTFKLTTDQKMSLPTKTLKVLKSISPVLLSFSKIIFSLRNVF